MKNFRAKTVLGLKWNLANRLISQFLKLGIGIILARLLSPEEFGIVGMVAVFSGFAGVFVDFGFTSAIIQNRESDYRHWSSVFWLNLIISFLLAVIFSLCAPLLVSFFNQPLLLYVSIAIAWTLFLQSFGLVQLSLLKKELKFKVIAKVELTSQILAGFFAIIAALNDFSYWSLVIQLYISAIIRSILLWKGTGWKPKLLIDHSAIKEMLNFSLPMIGMQVAHYWTHNIDNLIVGKFLGDTALGIYGRAYTLMLVPLQAISRVISSVMFPAFSLIQDDHDRIKSVYLSINRVVALITFPMMLGLVVVAEPFIFVLLGEKWMGVIPIIQVLAPLGAWRSVHSLNGNIFLARGKTKLLFRIVLPSSVLVAILMMVGVKYNGMIGLSVGYCFGSIVTGLTLDYYLNRLIGLNVRTNMMNLFPILIAATLMAGSIYLLDQFYLNAYRYIIRLVCLITAGILTYTILLWLLGLKSELIGLVQKIKK